MSSINGVPGPEPIPGSRPASHPRTITTAGVSESRGSSANRGSTPVSLADLAALQAFFSKPGLPVDIMSLALALIQEKVVR